MVCFIFFCGFVVGWATRSHSFARWCDLSVLSFFFVSLFLSFLSFLHSFFVFILYFVFDGISNIVQSMHTPLIRNMREICPNRLMVKVRIQDEKHVELLKAGQQAKYRLEELAPEIRLKGKGKWRCDCLCVFFPLSRYKSHFRHWPSSDQSSSPNIMRNSQETQTHTHTHTAELEITDRNLEQQRDLLHISSMVQSKQYLRSCLYPPFTNIVSFTEIDISSRRCKQMWYCDHGNSRAID